MAPRAMGVKAASHGPPDVKLHSAGIYADMTVDGPEIGTLILIVDRAKNLPNLRSVGKQDPYCAARLGKEAKKTDTDRRGGQRPQWDQELRFTVHESPDYHTLKVSVFNDDKKTDLIGECWVGLEDILKPGGGQADAWHHLNIKGRYAGEIRLELTYYDTRPKPERPRKESNAAAIQSDTDARLAGPRQPIARRPVPNDSTAGVLQMFPSAERASSYPLPSAAPHSIPTPSRQHVYSDSFNDGSYPPAHADYGYGNEETSFEHSYEQQQTFDERDQAHAESYDQSGRPLSSGSGHWQHPQNMDDQRQAYESYTPPQNAPQTYYTDASEPVGADSNFLDHLPTLPTLPPAQGRLQRLSGAHRARPAPPPSMPHTHSAPQLAPHELIHEQQHNSPSYDDQAYDRCAESQPEAYEQYNVPDRSYHHVTGQQSHAAIRQSLDSNGPPPPPTHRNSAPVAIRSLARPSPTQHSTPPSRALHISTTPSDFSSDNASPSAYGRSPLSASQTQSSLALGQPQQARTGYVPSRRQQSVDSYATVGYQTRSGVSPSHLSHDADPMIRPRDELSHDPRRSYDARADYADRPSPLGVQRPHPMSYAGPSHSSPQLPTQHRQPAYESPPVMKTHGVGPVSRPTFTTPRKDVSPRPLPEQVSSMNAYSPDSFGELNPIHSSRSKPGYMQGREPTPMYSSPGATPTREIEPQEPPSPDRVVNADGTVTTPDGRTKDASEHLPVSSYAPEPERKGADKNKANTRISIQNRFGPRDVSATPPSTSQTTSPASRHTSLPPVETRERLYRRAAAANGNSIGGSSPLSPAHPNILNFNPPVNNQKSPYPPPIPAKVPISPLKSRQDWMNDYEVGGEMRSLAGDLKMVNFKGDDDNVGRTKINGAGRLRKAKWSG